MTDDTVIDSGEIRPASLKDALAERYLAYAMSTIMSRSLPDVRDGLKPVHRRLLYAMRLLKLDPEGGFKKCARVVGDVIGKYHPHGDQSVYDALVRLAQTFAQRYPLVDGQGNFGNIDGDNAAAMRYTEARLTKIAELLLEGIDEDTVDFRATYDGEESEPVVLPAAFPNLLANGAAGIAVGMATSIPPHNAIELCDALAHLLRHPNASMDTLMEKVRAPDFPTGGVLVEPKERIREAFETGRGSFRVRARWEVEQLPRGTWQIVVTEIPYQVQKGRLIERIAELMLSKKLPLLADIRDESAEDIRLVLEPKSRTVEPEVLMQSLFRASDLESRFSLNMNVLDSQGVPRVMGLREVLLEYLAHRQVVLVRRSRNRLEKIEHRLEVLAGYLVVYLNLDEVIRIIREEDHPKASLMETFSLTDVQAEAILNMRLRSLRRLEEMELRREFDELSAEKGLLEALLADEDLQRDRLGEEVKALKKTLLGMPELSKRRTDIGEAGEIVEVPIQAFVEREPITVICSEKGWIRALRGHQDGSVEERYKEGDRGRFRIHAETTDKLLLFGTNGRFYTIGCDKLPGGRGHGEPVRLMIDLANDQDIVGLFVHKPDRKLLVASTDGRGFVVAENQVVAQTRNGRQVLNVASGQEALICTPVEGDSIAVVGDNRKLNCFALEEVPEMARGRGVVLQRYRDGGLSDVSFFNREEGVGWIDPGGRQRRETDLTGWYTKRGNAGRMVPRGFNRSNKFA
ncbi:DNA topoisomerase IV subunit A [Oceanibacterium hippocampi]|uniref:DNA topoisomerase 4 subunit A n=1 Tax=Oceanibacterium hippocampi TaxID=745714 RepID=A0A1Y5SSS0_9PROT|nr:DNA topoisomerase IV subunit A [Oceanibacterium hippocampi]SLN44321.1 DNA topoisomerase 4 subunit A [Oceanibacterium hippocampi]